MMRTGLLRSAAAMLGLSSSRLAVPAAANASAVPVAHMSSLRRHRLAWEKEVRHPVLPEPSPQPKLAWVESLYSSPPSKAPNPIGMLQLSNKVFGAPPRLDILHRVVVYQRSLWWQGTAKTKTRAEVRGGGKKPRKQKHTGMSRMGSMRSPLHPGGGIAHGPVPHSHAIKLPKKIRSFGLRVALSVKYAQGDLIIVDSLDPLTHKTQALDDVLKARGWKSVLFMTGREVSEKLALASRNIPSLQVIPCTSANVYDILHQATLVLSKEAVEYLEGRLNPDEPAPSAKYLLPAATTTTTTTTTATATTTAEATDAAAAAAAPQAATA